MTAADAIGPGWGPHEWEKIGGEEYRWHCIREKCGAIYVGADPPDAGAGCPSRGWPSKPKCAALEGLDRRAQVIAGPGFCDLYEAHEQSRPCDGACFYAGMVAVRPGHWVTPELAHKLRAAGGAGGVAAPALTALPDASDGPCFDTADGGRCDTGGIAHPRDATDRAPGGTVADSDRPTRTTVAGRPLASVRGIPVTTVAAVHVQRIESTLAAAGVCACPSCTAFAVAHDVDVLPMLAPAIAGRYAPGHGPTADGQQKHPDRELGVSHTTTVTRRSRGKK